MAREREGEREKPSPRTSKFDKIGGFAGFGLYSDRFAAMPIAVQTSRSWGQNPRAVLEASANLHRARRGRETSEYLPHGFNPHRKNKAL